MKKFVIGKIFVASLALLLAFSCSTHSSAVTEAATETETVNEAFISADGTSSVSGDDNIATLGDGVRCQPMVKPIKQNIRSEFSEVFNTFSSDHDEIDFTENWQFEGTSVTPIFIAGNEPLELGQEIPAVTKLGIYPLPNCADL